MSSCGVCCAARAGHVKKYQAARSNQPPLFGSGGGVACAGHCRNEQKKKNSKNSHIHTPLSLRREKVCVASGNTHYAKKPRVFAVILGGVGVSSWVKKFRITLSRLPQLENYGTATALDISGR